MSKFCTFLCDFSPPSWLLNCLEGSVVVFSKKARNYCFSFPNKHTNLQTNLADVEDVLDRVWNDSGSEGSISDSDHTTGNSNSDSESEEWSGDSAETS